MKLHLDNQFNNKILALYNSYSILLILLYGEQYEKNVSFNFNVIC